MGQIHIKALYIFSLIVIQLLFSCTSSTINRKLYEKEDVLKNKKFVVIQEQLSQKSLNIVKLHMKNGDAYILSDWERRNNEEYINGYGKKVDINRNYFETNNYSVPIEDISLIETSQVNQNVNGTSLIFSGVLTAAIGVYCALNPKACFGSCPTFYAYDGEQYSLQAEGFSSSILPSLEKRDIDALYNANYENNLIEILLTNEALETHYIRHADLIAIPRSDSTRILADLNDDFYEVGNFETPDLVIDAEENTIENLSKFDKLERLSLTDSNNLAAKEEFILKFENKGQNAKGIALSFRQSLVTTYLFYQSMAYMGSQVNGMFNLLDTNKKLREKFLYGDSVLGGIEIFINTNGKWRKINEINEKGPIAKEIKLIKLPVVTNDTLEIKIRMSKGYYKTGYAAVVDVLQKVEPIILKPSGIYKDGQNNTYAENCLRDSSKMLITMPGEKYRLVYVLPELNKNYELFMDSRGYYMEWMRREWLEEEDLNMVYYYLNNPLEYFKIHAPKYKVNENKMEELFWSSRYEN